MVTMQIQPMPRVPYLALRSSIPCHLDWTQVLLPVRPHLPKAPRPLYLANQPASRCPNTGICVNYSAFKP